MPGDQNANGYTAPATVPTITTGRCYRRTGPRRGGRNRDRGLQQQPPNAPAPMASGPNVAAAVVLVNLGWSTTTGV